MTCCAYLKIALVVGAQCAHLIQGQQFNAMQFQSRNSYSYPPQAQNLLRPQQVQQRQEQQPMVQSAPQAQELRLQQIRDQQNAQLWREAEEEEQREEQQKEQAVIQQKKQQQLVQLREQEQARTLPPADYKGLWTNIQAGMQGVTLQALYNIVLFVIAGCAVAFSLRTHLASALHQAKARAKASLSSNPEVIANEAPSVQIQKAPVQVEEDSKAAVALPEAPEAQDALASKSLSTAAKGVTTYLPRPPAERVPQSSKESTPFYLCEATFQKYDSVDALQKALNAHSQRVAQSDGSCILIAGNPGKQAASCAQQ